jgi:hypothetical protein
MTDKPTLAVKREHAGGHKMNALSIEISCQLFLAS